MKPMTVRDVRQKWPEAERRLMTHDERQAAAALELGYEVLRPGVS